MRWALGRMLLEPPAPRSASPDAGPATLVSAALGGLPTSSPPLVADPATTSQLELTHALLERQTAPGGDARVTLEYSTLVGPRANPAKAFLRNNFLPIKTHCLPVSPTVQARLCEAG